jgi:hypothetical protein
LDFAGYREPELSDAVQRLAKTMAAAREAKRPLLRTAFAETANAAALVVQFQR